MRWEKNPWVEREVEAGGLQSCVGWDGKGEGLGEMETSMGGGDRTEGVSSESGVCSDAKRGQKTQDVEGGG